MRLRENIVSVNRLMLYLMFNSFSCLNLKAQILFLSSSKDIKNFLWVTLNYCKNCDKFAWSKVKRKAFLQNMRILQNDDKYLKEIHFSHWDALAVIRCELNNTLRSHFNESSRSKFMHLNLHFCGSQVHQVQALCYVNLNFQSHLKLQFIDSALLSLSRVHFEKLIITTFRNINFLYIDWWQQGVGELTFAYAQYNEWEGNPSIYLRKKDDDVLLTLKLLLVELVFMEIWYIDNSSKLILLTFKGNACLIPKSPCQFLLNLNFYGGNINANKKTQNLALSTPQTFILKYLVCQLHGVTKKEIDFEKICLKSEDFLMRDFEVNISSLIYFWLPSNFSLENWISRSEANLSSQKKRRFRSQLTVFSLSRKYLH